ncbi:hypothetical protein [Rhodopseudomonas sp.]|uniref:hypothetical protein n=1 Tax=Rhodopseudomonas sp. TaxID=1078 RepID=UPI003B3B21DC
MAEDISEVEVVNLSLENGISDGSEIAPQLPLFHNTDLAGVFFIASKGEIRPMPFRADQFVYLAYGKPRYIRVKAQKELYPNGSWRARNLTLFSFVFPGMDGLHADSLSPFDSGYYLRGDLESDFQIQTNRSTVEERKTWSDQQLRMSANNSNAGRFVTHFWGSNAAYICGIRSQYFLSPQPNLNSGYEFVRWVLHLAQGRKLRKALALRKESAETIELRCSILPKTCLKDAVLYVPLDSYRALRDVLTQLRAVVKDVRGYARSRGGRSEQSDYDDLVSAMRATGVYDHVAEELN